MRCFVSLLLGTMLLTAMVSAQETSTDPQNAQINTEAVRPLANPQRPGRGAAAAPTATTSRLAPANQEQGLCSVRLAQMQTNPSYKFTIKQARVPTLDLGMVHMPPAPSCDDKTSVQPPVTAPPQPSSHQ